MIIFADGSPCETKGCEFTHTAGSLLCLKCVRKDEAKKEKEKISKYLKGGK